jgi:hypothetical protein
MAFFYMAGGINETVLGSDLEKVQGHQANLSESEIRHI